MIDDGKLAPHPALADFAEKLRTLRREAGDPTFQRLANGTRTGRTTLSQAFNGWILPSWGTVKAWVEWLNGDVETWKIWWAAAKAATQEAPVFPSTPRGSSPGLHLPPVVRHFVGRHRELARLTALLAQIHHSNGAAVVALIGGSAGIGKTTLAVRWARQHVDRFPDGLFYVDLRGFGPDTPMTATEALRGLLCNLGVPDREIPFDFHAQVARYRGLLEGKNSLLILDNARDTDQVRHLLPSSPTCMTLVTSRQELGSLIARHRASHLQLNLLTAPEAHQLLVEFLDGERVGAEAEAAQELLTFCVGLPLAVCIVAARAVMLSKVPLKVLADELRRERGRLQALTTGDSSDTDITAVFSWSYHALSADACRLFRLLGTHPGPDVGVPAAASLAGLAEADTRALLADLVKASLLHRDAWDRFRCHDLLRAYATQLSGIEDADSERAQALHRILDHYLHTAYSAALLLLPGREPLALPPPQAGVTSQKPQDVDHAVAWFTQEHPNLLAAIRQAADHGFDEHAWQLTEACSDFFDRQGHWHDWLANLRIALAASQRLSDRHAQARVHRDLGLACTRLSRYAEAKAHFSEAIDLFHRISAPVGEARAHIHLSYVFEEEPQGPDESGQLLEALACVDRALHLFRHAGHKTGEATAVDTMANYHLRLGNNRKALSLGKQALRLFQALEDPYGEASAWDNVGRACHGIGRHDVAVTCFYKALCLCRKVHDRYGEAYILHHLGDSLLELQDSTGTRESWSQALSIMEELGHRDTEDLQAKLARLR